MPLISNAFAMGVQQNWMTRARAQAEQAAQAGEVPVGVVLVKAVTNRVVFEGHNQVEATRDPTAHAEMLAIRVGCQVLPTGCLSDCDLYVTLEPCPMCAQALSFARIRRIIFGAFNPKGGGIDHGPRVLDEAFNVWRPEIIGGVQEETCAALLKGFFERLR